MSLRVESKFMAPPEPFSITAGAVSFRHAGRGVIWMLRSQHNAWLHAAATGVVCLAGIAFQLSAIECCLIVLCIMAVWTTEALNTALELVTDLASPDFHPLAGKAKDMAAGAVLITAVGAAIVGAIVFIPHAWALIPK